MLSTTAMEAAFAQETDSVFLGLVRIDHPTLSEPIRACADRVNAVSRGATYVAYPFEVTLPGDSADHIAETRLRIDHVDRQIVQTLRGLTTPATVDVEVVLAESPDTVEAGPFSFTLREAEYDAVAVEGVIRYEDILNEPYPAYTFTPSTAPGLF
jgi:hypothetical protein